jgi:quercetin dioxygenase-like cupin family protein
VVLNPHIATEDVRRTFFAGVLTSPGQLCPLIAPRMLRALWGKLSQKTEVAHFVEHATPKAILIWEEAMPTLVGFGTFAALPEEQISEKISRRVLSGDQGMIVWWSIGAGVHVEPHSHANEQIVWMLKGLVTEQRVCGPGDVVVIPGGSEHEAFGLGPLEFSLRGARRAKRRWRRLPCQNLRL